MSVNFLTSNIVLIYFSPGDGGKFLTNMLGLSSDAVLQNAYFAEQQLEKNFSTFDKFCYLNNELDIVTDRWQDFDLGCSQLFRDTDYTNKILTYPYSFDFDPIVKRLSNNTTKFFLLSHSAIDLHRQLQVWPNASVIVFDDNNEFRHKYRPKKTVPDSKSDLQQYWDTVRDSRWPLHPPNSMAEFDLLSDCIKVELRTVFKNSIFFHMTFSESKYKIKCFIDQCLQNEKSYSWSSALFLDETLFMQNLCKLYSCLDLGAVDKAYVLQLYRKWIHVLQRLSVTNK